ncbi:MAG: GGDEF domain-containing protein [Sideroxyarcus sp.]|nr:GGDEF domain-containing protein [Sideroxyarcus sp.]
MLKLKSIADSEFGADDYFEFRFQLLRVSLWVAILFSGALILADWLGINHQGDIHLTSIEVFFLSDVALAIYLGSRKDRFVIVALLFLAAWFLVNVSALYFLTNNEFRAIWFFVLVLVAYTILGLSPGLLATILSLVTLAVANKYLSAPFSSNAMITMLFSLCAGSAFLYSYTKRFAAYRQHLKEANKQLRDLASHDPLTGIRNARAFYEDSELVARQALRSEKKYSVLFMDIDHFKLINDRYGHEVGDIVLKEFASCLTRNIRETDLLGRIGGEEFLLLLPDTDMAGAKLLAEKLRQKIEELMPLIGETRIPITTSIGIAVSQTKQDSIARLKQEADQAMYQAKANGRNCVATLAD